MSTHTLSFTFMSSITPGSPETVMFNRTLFKTGHREFMCVVCLCVVGVSNDSDKSASSGLGSGFLSLFDLLD